MICIQKVDGRYVVDYMECPFKIKDPMHGFDRGMPVAKTLIFDTGKQIGYWFQKLDDEYELETNK